MEPSWIVEDEQEAIAVLNHPALQVRPPGERVPKTMHGTRLGGIFERLVRMNEGPRHAELRRLVEGLLEQWDLSEVARIAREAAGWLPSGDVAAYTVATLVGIRRPEQTLPWIRDFAGAIAAGAGEEAVARGIAAAEPLAASLEPADPDEVANRLGFLFQTYAATAKLIENLLEQNTDPPVLATRRYAAEDVVICGKNVRKGDTITISLTSPRLHFGAGRHTCPGRVIAETIAHAALQVIHDAEAGRDLPPSFVRDGQ